MVAIPKTMDNDVHGTEYCIGFSTAVTRAKELINRQRTTLGSHERIGVFRIFGRNAGYTAWYAAYVTSARCVIPEVRFDLGDSDMPSALLTARNTGLPERLSSFAKNWSCGPAQLNGPRRVLPPLTFFGARRSTLQSAMYSSFSEAYAGPLFSSHKGPRPRLQDLPAIPPLPRKWRHEAQEVLRHIGLRPSSSSAKSFRSGRAASPSRRRGPARPRPGSRCHPHRSREPCRSSRRTTS